MDIDKLRNLDDEAINVLIWTQVIGKGARIHSWVIFPDEPCWGCGIDDTPENRQTQCKAIAYDADVMPNFCNDYNACFAAQTKFALCQILFGSRPDFYCPPMDTHEFDNWRLDVGDINRIVAATARERCIAMLAAVGEKDEK